MDARLKEEKVMDERLKIMPFVRADYGKQPSYAIFRVTDRRCKSMQAVRSFICHILRLTKTPNADSERTKNNDVVYGPENIIEDTENYLSNVKIYKNSVFSRDLLLTASPQFFLGMTKQDFEKWIDTNRRWLLDTFHDNVRSVVLHCDETTWTPHLHALIVPKQWNEKRKCYTLQNYHYFNGYQMLRDLQDSYAEAMQKDFPTLNRGIRFSKSSHQKMQKLYGIIDNTEKESLEVLQAKAANQELLKIRNTHMEKTLKSYQNSNRRKDETIEILLKEIQDLKKNNQYKDLKETLEATTEKKKGISRNFSGKRYNKSM